jgi:hypothetical protein
VKLERLLKVPRSGRTIHIVINVPESSAPPAVISSPPKPTRSARTWAVLKVAGPATVATAAIIISILSLQGQGSANRDLQQANAAAQQANATAATSRQRQGAEHVSFLQNPLRHPPFTSLLVENLATTPVYNATFQVQAIVNINHADAKGGAKGYINGLVGGKGYVTKTFTLWLGNIPACSSGAVNIVPAATAALLKRTKLTAAQLKGPVAAIAEWMSFEDSNGVAWRYFGLEELKQLQGPPMNTFSPDGYLQATYRAATGCT